MRLEHIKIAGFRNIDEVNLELNDLTALIGVNNYGKSNILDAIDFGIDFITRDSTTRKDMMSWGKGVPLNKSNAFKDFSFEITLKTEFINKAFFVNYAFTFAWAKKDEDEAQVLFENLKIKLDEKSQKYQTLIQRTGNKAVYKSSETARCNTPIKTGNKFLIINKLKEYDNLFYHEIILKLNSLRVYIERHLDSNLAYGFEPLVRKGVTGLDISDMTSIPRAIYQLKEKYVDKYLLLENAFIQLFPNIKKIFVDVMEFKAPDGFDFGDDQYVFTDKIYAMKVQDTQLINPLPFERLSDGVKRVFLMLTYALVADIKGLSLLAIEEPENSIHPNLLQNYLQVLTQLVNNCKIIVASHSPYMIQYIDISSLYIGIPNDDGIADFRKIAKNKYSILLKDATESDSSTGDYIFGLLSGSKDDLAQLSDYLEK